MYIYNITIKVDWTIHEEWLDWMNNKEIPRMIENGYFNRYQMLRLLDIDEIDGPTYAVQYYAPSLLHYNNYLSERSAIDGAKSYALWGQQTVFFSTLMQVVH